MTTEPMLLSKPKSLKLIQYITIFSTESLFIANPKTISLIFKRLHSTDMQDESTALLLRQQYNCFWTTNISDSMIAFKTLEQGMAYELL